MEQKLRDRIKSEAMAAMPIRNADLICKDCLFRYDDSEIPGNTGKCDVYPEYPDYKPNEVIKGGDCEYYEREEK